MLGPLTGDQGMNKRDVVIIGGGPAGRVIVHALHAAGADMSITLIKDEAVNVNRCAVPYGIPEGKPLEKYDIPNKLVTNFGAELIIDTVDKLDPERNLIQTREGREFEYSNLVLATGSRALIPPIPGIEGNRITGVRSRDDLALLRQWAKTSKKALIVGGGYIGIEVAVVLRRMGLEVTVVEMLPHILSATTEPEFIKVAENDLREHGLNLVTGSAVEEFLLNNDGVFTGVRLQNGEIIDADFAAVAIGVIPNSELAAQAGLATNRMGIVVDDFLRTAYPNIYASGDCAVKKSFITGEPTRGEFGTNAVFMSKVVAANILGEEKKFPGVINANCSTSFTCAFGSAGLTEKQAQEQGMDVISGTSEVLSAYPVMDEAKPVLTKLVFERQSGRLVGGSVLRRDHATAMCVDFISFAIQMGAGIEDIMTYQYATHPELAAKPSDDIYLFAARDALKKRQLQAV